MQKNRRQHLPEVKARWGCAGKIMNKKGSVSKMVHMKKKVSAATVGIGV